MGGEVTRMNNEPLVFIVVKLGRLLERQLDRSSSGGELTASQLLVLSLIARHPGSSRADVARRVHISPQAVGGVLSQLLAAGMITRADRVVGRPLEVSVTNKGCRVLEDAETQGDLSSQRTLEVFRADHRAFVEGAMRHLLRSLEMDDVTSAHTEIGGGQRHSRHGTA